MEEKSKIGWDTGDRPLKFRCFAPNATKVCLAGEFNEWHPSATPMERLASGEWEVAVRLPPGTVEYKFVVDGDWCCQPGMSDHEYAGADAVWNTFGTRNRVLLVA